MANVCLQLDSVAPVAHVQEHFKTYEIFSIHGIILCLKMLPESLLIDCNENLLSCCVLKGYRDAGSYRGKYLPRWRFSRKSLRGRKQLGKGLH